MSKFPYKVGNKVLEKGYESPVDILEMTWNGSEIEYRINIEDEWLNAEDLQPYKEDMEGKLISNEEMSLKIDISQMEKRQIVFSADAPDETELVLGDNFEIKVDNGKTFVVRKKPQYPKSYKECCDVLGLCTMDNDAKGYKSILIIRFQELLIARNAYWKIAGEQMGLGKPWEPDFSNIRAKKYIIYINYEGNVKYDSFDKCHAFLAFPTIEMCIIFIESFKDLIESCKSLL